MKDQVFEIVGYHLDYWIKGKYSGYVKASQPDRDVTGYGGRITETLQNALTTSSRSIPAGVTVTHELIPICGKIKGATLEDRIEVIRNHYQTLNK